MNNYLLKYGSSNLLYVLILIILGIVLKNKYIIILAILVLIFLFYFFRVPVSSKKYLHEDNMVVAPSFGKVTNIIENDDSILVSTFLSVFDPHVQYIPINSHLNKIKYFPGKFNAANFFKKTRYNERCSYYLKSKFGNLVVTQIAGMIARKIVSFVKPNNNYNQGTELGMIKFGSRVDILIEKNKNYKFFTTCKVGDYLNGNESQIGYFST